jgi:hypothetical protein
MNALTKTAAAALAALTLTAGLVATSSSAQAFPKKGWGPGIGLGIAAGALIGAAAYNSAYGAPAYVTPGYVVDPGYVSCRKVESYDAYGNFRGMLRVCDVD